MVSGKLRRRPIAAEHLSDEEIAGVEQSEEVEVECRFVEGVRVEIPTEEVQRVNHQKYFVGMLGGESEGNPHKRSPIAAASIAGNAQILNLSNTVAIELD